MQAGSLSSYDCYDSRHTVMQTLSVQVTPYIFETQRGWQKVIKQQTFSRKQAKKKKRKGFHGKQHKVNYKLKNHMRLRKTECPQFVGDIRRDGIFPLLFLFRPAHYSILLKHPGEAVHHTRIPSKECFPSSISTVQKRRLQPEAALENCNW